MSRHVPRPPAPLAHRSRPRCRDRDVPGALEAAWADPATRVLVAGPPQGPARRRPRPPPPRPAAARRGPGSAARALPGPHARGRRGRSRRHGRARGPRRRRDRRRDRADESRWADLRMHGATLDARDAGLFAEALGLANWHGIARPLAAHRPAHRRRPRRLGAPRGARGESSGEHVFPRTDAAVIVGVVDARDRLLLASNAAWPEDRYSVLAGSSSRASRSRPPSCARCGRRPACRSPPPSTSARSRGRSPPRVMVGFLARTAPACGPRAGGGRDRDPRGPVLRARGPRRGGRRPAASACPAAPRSPGRSSSTGTAASCRATGDAVSDADALLDPLDEQQRAAATALTGAVCVLAGAGTGKTRAITHRIAYGVATGVYPPKRVMALTFTTRAASELRSRLGALGASGVAARTFHAAALAQLNYFWPQVLGASAPKVLDHKARLSRQAAEVMRLRLDTAAVRDAAAEIEFRKASAMSMTEYAERRDRPGAAVRARRREDGAAPGALRDAQGRAAPHRLRGRAARDGRHDHERAAGRHRGAGAVPLLHRRRVPGRLARRSSCCSTRGSASGRTSASSATRARRSTRSPGRRPSTCSASASARAAPPCCGSSTTTARSTASCAPRTR